MTTSGGDIQNRLSDLWTAWGLSPDEMMSEVQHRAAEATSMWIERGKTEPEIAIRAVQILLADPERPGWSQRPCWIAMRKALREAWRSAGHDGNHLFYAQALLLAAWPSDAQAGYLSLAPLLDSAWEVMRGRDRQSAAIDAWRLAGKVPPAPEEKADKSAAPEISLDQFSGVQFSSNFTSWWNHLARHNANWHNASIGDQLFGVLTDYRTAFEHIGAAVQTLSSQLSTYLEHQRQHMLSIGTRASAHRNELALLWWGQARYCRARQTPYRRLGDPDDVLWWAAREAAELSLSLDVEPAAAYLVETLHSLGQNVFEKRPLLQWMEGLHAVLKSNGERVSPLSTPLEQIAREDALGLPVTWVRLKVARKDALTSATDDLTIDLEAEIDRGQWASWIFRETLLDLRLSDGA